ncbi:MAG: KpsF/GutQ family sugar-phosphate isomerase [Bacteroidales bacterium]|nr:KpsF/GutQ family sugar-phosphate isomerase [Bacteroidales bacterium]MBO7530028.1 KpsF/GutQ family sugar-phosphate isomerase [Bacteroidales bacterium]
MENLREIALQVIDTEANSITGLKALLTDDFEKVVELIYNSKGNVIVSGIGKSANIAQKIVATLNSTGTTAVFMHAADAIHGDLGIIRDDDVVIIVSKSGETPEIKVLIPLIKIRKNKLVAIVGNKSSYLASQADFVLDTTVPREACPNNLAPTSSTTAQLVMGDAMAVALLKMRGFTAEDFAKFHPGGALGKRLYLTVGDVCIKNGVPQVKPDDIMTQAIIEISEKMLGAAAVIENDRLVGIVTDGDLRRMLMKHPNIETVRVNEIMTKNPTTIEKSAHVADALNIMQSKEISVLPVMEDGKYVGMIHIHDIIKEGII